MAVWSLHERGTHLKKDFEWIFELNIFIQIKIKYSYAIPSTVFVVRKRVTLI